MSISRFCDWPSAISVLCDALHCRIQGTWGPGSPLTPMISGNFEGKPSILSKFWAQVPCPWGQNLLGLPDQNPGSSPALDTSRFYIWTRLTRECSVLTARNAVFWTMSQSLLCYSAGVFFLNYFHLVYFLRIYRDPPVLGRALSDVAGQPYSKSNTK